MNMQLQLILPSVVVPFMLSVILFALTRKQKKIVWGLPLILLPSYFWLAGWPQFSPEANGWLWLLIVLSTAFNIGLMKYARQSALAQIGLLAIILTVIVWPVIQYQPDLAVILELFVLLFAGFVYFFNAELNCSAMPSLSLVISSVGLALVTALGGSVLIGQMAAVLAAILGVFAIVEIYRLTFMRPELERHDSEQSTSLTLIQLVPLMQVYFALLFIARIYAEISLVSTTLLLVAPLTGVLRSGRFTVVLSCLSVAAALLWLLFTADGSSYY